MDKNKAVKIYFLFLAILAIAIIVLGYFDSQEKNKIDELNKQYNVNKQAGEILVECHDGSYDVYKPNDISQTHVCGESTQKTQYVVGE